MTSLVSSLVSDLVWWGGFHAWYCGRELLLQQSIKFGMVYSPNIPFSHFHYLCKTNLWSPATANSKLYNLFL